MTERSIDMQLTQSPTAKAEMLVRRPVAEVFDAFVDPGTTAKFWFTTGSGRLEPGAHVQWNWEMYGVSTEVHVVDLVPNERIVIEWTGASGPETVEWRFTPLADGTTFVSMANTGFRGSGDEMVKQAIESTEAATMVLAGLKALLEHGIALNLVADRFPAGVEPA